MIAFFSILYNPAENAIKNIVSAKKFGYMPVVYVNQVSDECVARLESESVIILGINENVGIGKAFNDAEIYFADNNIDYFIYFDQDTVVNDQAWLDIRKSYLIQFKNHEMGLIYYGFSKRESPLLVVSSGSLFSMAVLQEIGFHDPDFFVEGVDYEMCLRLKKNRYKISFIPEDGIDHFSLQDSDFVKIFGLDLRVRCYGNKRWKDFNSSHIKLLNTSLMSREWKMVLLFIKSFLIFNYKEIKSRFLKAIL